MSDETQALLHFLDMERNHVLGILEGLSEEQVRRPVLPSGWNCLGLVKHLALADEHYWFRSVVGGESFDFFPTGRNAEWQVDPGESAEDVFNLYRDEIERANAIITTTPLDRAPRQRDPDWGTGGTGSPTSGWSCFTCSRKPPATQDTSTQCASSSTVINGSSWETADYSVPNAGPKDTMVSPACGTAVSV